jgi:ankyrin repeat protein
MKYYNLITLICLISCNYALEASMRPVVRTQKPYPGVLKTPTLYSLHYMSDVNKPNTYGNTPLYEAIAKNKLWLVRLFLQYGADLTHRNNYGQTPLDFAALTCYNRKILTILSVNQLSLKNKDISSQPIRTPLHWAALTGNIFAVEIRANKFPESINSRDGLGLTPLELAKQAYNPKSLLTGAHAKCVELLNLKAQQLDKAKRSSASPRKLKEELKEQKANDDQIEEMLLQATTIYQSDGLPADWPYQEIQ